MTYRPTAELPIRSILSAANTILNFMILSYTVSQFERFLRHSVYA